MAWTFAILCVAYLPLFLGKIIFFRDLWCASIARTATLGANEIYLYSLYTRPHTGLHERATEPDNRIALYRAGRASAGGARKPTSGFDTSKTLVGGICEANAGDVGREW